jgi:hypothetical protein
MELVSVKSWALSWEARLRPFHGPPAWWWRRCHTLDRSRFKQDTCPPLLTHKHFNRKIPGTKTGTAVKLGPCTPDGRRHWFWPGSEPKNAANSNGIRKGREKTSTTGSRKAPKPYPVRLAVPIPSIISTNAASCILGQGSAARTYDCESRHAYPTAVAGITAGNAVRTVEGVLLLQSGMHRV